MTENKLEALKAFSSRKRFEVLRSEDGTRGYCRMCSTKPMTSRDLRKIFGKPPTAKNPIFTRWCINWEDGHYTELTGTPQYEDEYGPWDVWTDEESDKEETIHRLSRIGIKF